MSTILHAALVAVTLALGGAAGVTAQAPAPRLGPDGATAGSLPPLLPEAEEVRLARTAGPPDITARAGVWVLRRHGYERVVRGSNGWTCLVERDHPNSLAPLCYDPEGSRTVVPWVLEVARLRAGGLSYVAASDSADTLYREGALPRVTRPVLSYMLSKEQRLHATPTGPEVGAWRPHVMIHHPGWTPAELGLEEAGGVVTIGGGASAVPYLVVPVARWSDGSPAGG